MSPPQIRTQDGFVCRRKRFAVANLGQGPRKLTLNQTPVTTTRR